VRRLVCIALCVGLAGCGFGAGDKRGGSGAELRVTRDFGRTTITTASKPSIRQSDTVMRFLQAHAKTTTRYGGKFVQSIGGLAGSSKDGRNDWFYFVNGVEAPTGAADRVLAPGDVVQWDYRRWDASPRVPAIVGAYPEPFLHGQKGTRYPTRIECADSATKACDDVQSKLEEVGIVGGSGVLGSEARGGVLRIEVGKWSDLRKLQDLDVLEKGPTASGVFVRFSDNGSKLQLLDAQAKVTREAPPGTGLVAAILPPEQQPLWVVTGVDDAGVARAAALLEKATLRNAYAVAALPSGPERLPLGAGG
jgi:Domain of unknown function (DUF4430)